VTHPPTLHGWPVRWERRGRIDDGDTTRVGLTAVVDRARLGNPTLLISIDDDVVSELLVYCDDLDGQPLDCLDDLALTLARETLSARLVP